MFFDSSDDNAVLRSVRTIKYIGITWAELLPSNTVVASRFGLIALDFVSLVKEKRKRSGQMHFYTTRSASLAAATGAVVDHVCVPGTNVGIKISLPQTSFDAGESATKSVMIYRIDNAQAASF